MSAGAAKAERAAGAGGAASAAGAAGAERAAGAEEAAAVERTAAELVARWGAVWRRLRRGAREAVGGVPLSGAQVELLRLVEARPGIGVREAAAALHVAANTVSTLVGGLVADGLLERRPDPRDGRAVRLELTAAARTRLRRWRDERTRLLTAALAELDAADRAALAASIPALERLVAALGEEGAP